MDTDEFDLFKVEPELPQRTLEADKFVPDSDVVSELKIKLEADDRALPLILIIDDDPTVRNALGYALESDYRMLFSSSGEDGIQTVNSDVSAVVLDVKMQGKNGFETFVEIKKKFSNLPIIFHSAYQDLKDPYEVLNEYRPFGYINKEGSAKELADTLVSAVQYRRQIRNNELLVNALQKLTAELEQRVEQRTVELTTTVETLGTTLTELKTTQTQLIQSEKMATLGQLVASVAHEINTPIGVVLGSGEIIAASLDKSLENMPILFQVLDQPGHQLFMRLLHHARASTIVLSSGEERSVIKATTQQLEQAEISDARRKAGILVQLGAHASLADYFPLLRHPESSFILQTASQINAIIRSTGSINTAVAQVSKIVFALKSFSRTDRGGQMREARLQDGIDTVLTIYQSQIRQGIELVRHYEDIPPLSCLPDELNQVWTNLIHNALHAMRNSGTLTIQLRRVGNNVVMSVGDTGCGIPDDIRGKIFEPFFTTKPIGEGSGLGLDIVKKIVDKHQGRIEVESAVGVGTTFAVFLPYERH